MLSEGDKAPQFDLEADDGTRVTLKGSLRDDGFVVLYFYPRDNTPGCTREAQAFSAAKRKLAAAGATVLGVSKDSIKSHCGFKEKYALDFALLSDPDLVAHRAYGAYGEKTMYGKKVMGTLRSTFLIDGKGRIARVWPNVKVDGHVEQVLAAIGGAEAAPVAKKTATKGAAASAKKTAKKSAKKS
jgi:peroxiredoxin Q/BCP